MKIINIKSIENFKEENLVITLGFFDGFHLGHLDVLKKAIEIKNEYKLKAALFTFNESFQSFKNNETYKYITSLDDKIELASKLGFNEVIIVELSNEFVNQSKEEFINNFLIKQAHIVCGFDYTFGRDRDGSIDYLKDIFKERCHIANKKDHNGLKIGTKEIREYLSNGDVENVKELLDRPYKVKGHMAKWNKFNMMIPFNYIIPRNGNYEMILKYNNDTLIFNGKIKANENQNGFIIKSENSLFKSLEFEKDDIYELSFMKMLK